MRCLVTVFILPYKHRAGVAWEGDVSLHNSFAFKVRLLKVCTEFLKNNQNQIDK